MKRSLVFMLTLIFVFAIFAGPAAPKADAVVVSTVVVGTVIAALAAAGIGLSVSGMTSSQLADWVGGKLDTWASSLGGSVQDHIDGNLITATGRGFISIGTAAAKGITDFITWLVQDQSVTNNSSVVVLSPETVITPTNDEWITVIGATGWWGPFVMRQADYYTNPQTVYIFAYYDQVDSRTIWTGPIAVCQNNTPVIRLKRGNTAGDGWINAWEYDQTTGLYYTNLEKFVLVREGGTVTYNTFKGTIRQGLDFIKNGIDNDTWGQGLTIDAGTITVPVIDANSTDKWFIDVGAVPGSTIETVTDGVIADTIEGDLTVSGDVAEEEPEFVIDEPIAVTGLSEVFPFCIPFDIYALLSALSADPQTPVFRARFVVPGIIDEEFTIDLSPFNAVAQIVRTMELLAFIIGLALVTRERFLRS